MSLPVLQELAPTQRKESFLVHPLRNKGEPSNYSLCLTTVSHSTDLHIVLMIFFGKTTALFAFQIKRKKVKRWLGERGQGMLGYSPENKRYCVFWGGWRGKGGWRHRSGM